MTVHLEIYVGPFVESGPQHPQASAHAPIIPMIEVLNIFLSDSTFAN